MGEEKFPLKIFLPHKTVASHHGIIDESLWGRELGMRWAKWTLAGLLAAAMALFSAAALMPGSQADWTAVPAPSQALIDATKDLPEVALDVKYDDTVGQVSGSYAVTLTLPEGAEDVALLLRPNAYDSIDALPFDDEGYLLAFANGASAGWIDIQGVTVDGVPTTPIYTESKLHMRVAPPEGATRVTISMSFITQLPSAWFSFAGNALGVFMTDFAPELCVWDGVQWRTDRQVKYANSRLMAAANVDLTLACAEGFAVAWPFALTGKTANGVTTWQGRGLGLRGLSLALTVGGHILGGQAGDTAVFCMAETRSAAKAALDTALATLPVLTQWLGDCPTPAVYIVEAGLLEDSLALPGLVLVHEALFAARQRDALRTAVAEGMAGQWFGNLVAADDSSAPWLNAGLRRSVGLAALEQVKPALGGRLYRQQVERAYQRAQISMYEELDVVRGRADQSAMSYPGYGAYLVLACDKSAIALRTMQQELETPRMMAALRAYLAECAYGVGGKQVFLDAVHRSTGIDYANWLARQLNPTVYIPAGE